MHSSAGDFSFENMLRRSHEHHSADRISWPTDESSTALTHDNCDWLWRCWSPGRTAVARDRDFAKSYGWQITSDHRGLSDYQYVSLNGFGRRYVWCIVVDVDDASRLPDLQEFCVPPNLIGRNVGSDPFRRGNFQAIWVLQVPVRRDMPRPWDYLKRIRHTLTDPWLFGGDTAFTHGMSRNPFYSGESSEYAWTMLHEHRWSLDELAKGLERDGFPVPRPGQPLPDPSPATLPGPDGSAPRAAGSSGSGSDSFWLRDHAGKIRRNDSLFHACRRFAYSQRAQNKAVTTDDVLHWLRPMNDDLEHLDPVRKGLPASELRGIANSVSRFCRNKMPDWAATNSKSYRRYTYVQCYEGGFSRSAQPSFRDAQAEGRATQIRRADQAATRAQALRRLGHSVEKIASLISRGISTVYRYLKRCLPLSSEHLDTQGISDCTATENYRTDHYPSDAATGEKSRPRKLRIVAQSSPIDVPVYAIESAEESTSATRVRERDQGRSRSAPGRLKSVS